MNNKGTNHTFKSSVNCKSKNKCITSVKFTVDLKPTKLSLN